MAMDDKKLYQQATEEAENENGDVALWAKAMALSSGDREKAKYNYIKFRVSELIEEQRIGGVETQAAGKAGHEPKISPPPNNGTIKDDKETSDSNLLLKLINGDFGLVKTYWLYGVIFPANLSMLLVGVDFDSTDTLVFLSIMTIIYQVVVLLGVWRAANKYTGQALWVILAKIWVVLGWGWNLTIVVAIIGLI